MHGDDSYLSIMIRLVSVLLLLFVYILFFMHRLLLCVSFATE